MKPSNKRLEFKAGGGITVRVFATDKHPVVLELEDYFGTKISTGIEKMDAELLANFLRGFAGGESA